VLGKKRIYNIIHDLDGSMSMTELHKERNAIGYGLKNGDYEKGCLEFKKGGDSSLERRGPGEIKFPSHKSELVRRKARHEHRKFHIFSTVLGLVVRSSTNLNVAFVQFRRVHVHLQVGCIDIVVELFRGEVIWD
jgi:hypothetical protein